MPNGQRDAMICTGAELVEIADDSGLRTNAAWPKTLAELVDVLESHFRRFRSSGDPRTEAEAAIAVIAEHFGGHAVYLPRGDSLRRALRDRRIANEFDGTNVGELARRNRMSTVQVRAILKKNGRGPQR